MPTRFLLVSFLLTAVAITMPGTVRADEPDEATYRRLNTSLAENDVVPRYRRLAEATAELDRQAAAFCAAPDGASLATVRDAFNQGVDAFQGVQHFNFGPAEMFMRSVRLAFWPDPRNAASRQMEPILTTRDTAAISQDSFDHGSVAVQGFPAVERLLFDDDFPPPWPADDQGRFRCQYLRAITANLTHMAQGILADWTTGEHPYIAVFAAAGNEGNPYPTAQDATVDLFRSLVSAIELASERKLARPLGESIEKARPRLAESWRSGRSLENIRRNLEAAEALYLGEGGFGFSAVVRDTVHDVELDDLLRHAFAQTRETSRSITVPLSDAVSSEVMRPRLEQLLTETTALRRLLVQRLAPALGVPVGFNSLDGD